MDDLYSQLDSYKDKFKITTNSNPIPLSLKLLDTSSIGLNHSLKDILQQNNAINELFKKHILENEDNILELNDNLNNYMKIFIKYIHTKNVDFVESESGSFNTNNLKTLNDKINKNAYVLKLLSLIEMIINKQRELEGKINQLNMNIENLELNLLKSFIKQYSYLDELTNSNKLFLLKDYNIVNNNLKIKSKINALIEIFIIKVIFDKNSIYTENELKAIFLELIELLDNSELMHNIITNINTDKTFEKMLIKEINYLKYENMQKYEVIKKYKFKTLKDILNDNNDSNINEIIKKNEYDIIVYEFFETFFSNLEAKFQRLLTLSKLVDSGSGDNANTDLVINQLEAFILKIMKFYLIPSFNIKSDHPIKPQHTKIFNIDRSLITGTNASVVTNNNNDLLIVPANVLNLKFILPNLIPILKLSTNSNFMNAFLNHQYLNEVLLNFTTFTILKNNNIASVHKMISNFIIFYNKIFTLFKGLEFQFNNELLTKIVTNIEKFVNELMEYIVSYFKQYEINNRSEKKFDINNLEVVKKEIDHWLINHVDIDTVVTCFDMLDQLKNLSQWYENNIIFNVIDEDKDDNIVEQWIINDEEIINNNDSVFSDLTYLPNINGVQILSKLNIHIDSFMKDKFDKAFINDYYYNKAKYYSLYLINKCVGNILLNNDSNNNLYLREDLNTNENITKINTIVKRLSNEREFMNEFINFSIIHNFMKLKSFNNLKYIIINLLKLNDIDCNGTINILKLYQLNVNDIIDIYNNNNVDADVNVVKHLVKMKIVEESDGNQSILNIRLNELYKKMGE
ncbi:hypothetical protein ACO0OL_000564 [Hanseniaspora opuntiae]